MWVRGLLLAAAITAASLTLMFPSTSTGAKDGTKTPVDMVDVTIETNVDGVDTEKVVFAPNGRYLAAAAGNRITLWDIDSGRPLRVLEDFAYINHIKISADSKTIISNGKDGRIKYWNAETGRKERSAELFESDGDWFRGFRLYNNGEKVVFSARSVIGIWDTRLRKQLLHIGLDTISSDYQAADDTRLSGSGREILIAANNWGDTPSAILTVNLKTVKVTQKVLLPEGWQVVSSGLVTDRHVLAASKNSYLSCETDLALFDLTQDPPSQLFVDKTPGCPKTKDGERDYENDSGAVNWFQDVGGEKLFVARTGRQGVGVWHLANGQQERIALSANSTDEIVAYEPSLNRIALKRGDALQIVDTRNGEEKTLLRGQGSDSRPRTTYDPDTFALYLDDYDYGHQTVLWSSGRVAPIFKRFALPEGSKIVHSVPRKNIALAINEASGRVTLVSSTSGQVIKEFRIRGLDDSWRARLSPDAKLLLARIIKGDANTAVLIEVNSGRVLKYFSPRVYESPYGTDEEYVTTYTFSHDGRHFGIGWWGGAAEVWATADLKKIIDLPRGDDQTTSLEFSQDGRYLIGGSRDSDIFVWHLPSGKLQQSLGRSVIAGHVSTGAVAISEDGHLVAAGPLQRAVSSGDTGRERRIHVWDAQTGEIKFLLKGHQSNVAALSFSKDRRWIISADYSGTIRYWRRIDGQLAATFAIGKNGEWVIVTDVGFFAASSDAGELLSVVRGFEATTIDQLWQSLYNPDLVREYLTGDVNGEVEKAARTAYLSKILDTAPAPRVDILKAAPSADRADAYDVTARITDMGKGVGRIEWRVNGVVSNVTTQPAVEAGGAKVLTRQLVLDKGENVIRVTAYNGGNVLASRPSRTTVRIDRQNTVEPVLHVLAIGINDYVDKGWVPPGSKERLAFGPLNLAVRDAQVLSDALSQAAAGRYREVKITKLLDSGATREKLIATVDRIAPTIDPRDTFILFAAAHGTSHAGRFYLIPQDFQGGSNPDALASRAIDQELLQDWLGNKIKARKALVLLDTCESGALISGHQQSRLDTPASDAAVGRLHEATGRPVLTAAASGQFAHEGVIGDTGKTHGIFTWSLLDALKNGDADANETIELSELVGHVQQLVPKLAAELGGLARAATAVRQPVFGEQSARFGSRGEDFSIVARLP